MELWQISGICLALALALGICAPVEAKRIPIAQVASAHWATPVAQSVNLYRVTPALYRSEQLGAKDVAVLQQNNIKTIINLRFFDRDEDQEDLTALKLNLVNQPLTAWHVTPKQIAQVLYQIEQSQQQGPVLVHCRHGADRTGLIIGMYRIIYQGWAPEAAKQEMMQGPYGFHTIWRNIPKMYNDHTVQQVTLELQQLKAQTAK